MAKAMSGDPPLRRFAWGVLLANMLVIVWGAYVRASGSGAGCGKHWPLCNGEVLPRAPRVATLVELSHRASSGLVMLLVVGFAIAVFVRTPSGHPARRTSVWAAILVLGEAVIGAGLVLLALVEHDRSMLRAASIMLHLGNTFFLLTALTLTVHYLGGAPRVRIRGQGVVAVPLVVALAVMFVLGLSGALAALGDTLFPARSLAEGMQQDVTPGAHFLIRLRVFHPVLALATGVVVALAASLARTLRPDNAQTRIYSRALVLMFFVQVGVGLLNLDLLVPIWTQLLHLLCADVTFILLVLTAAVTLRADTAKVRAIFEDDETRGAVHQR